MAKYKSIEWIKETGSLRLLNQLILPGKLEYKDYTTADDIAEAIRDMTVRGAPAIGVAAAYGLLAAAHEVSGSGIDSVKSKLASADKILRASRPTAVNLFWALDEMAKRTQFESATDELALVASLEAAADAIAQEDVVINTSIGENAMSLMPEHKVTFIHHCNTGSLATVDYGTALGIIRMAHEKGLETNVFVDETRPRLQG
ncbi:MAG: S-methyl-5-thioribose-1-phosphate isomerase, partial [Halioglobus sp.]